MRKKLSVFVVLLLAAILSGYMLNEFLKKAGLENIFEFDLSEEDDEESLFQIPMVYIDHSLSILRISLFNPLGYIYNAIVKTLQIFISRPFLGLCSHGYGKWPKSGSMAFLKPCMG